MKEKELEKEKTEKAVSEGKETKEAAASEKENKESSEKEEKASEKKKDPKDEKIDELNDKLKRSMAEFDNYRKRTDKEKSAMYEIGAKDVIEKILPIVDNFERGLNSIPEDAKGSAFADGMEKIYKQFVKTLDDMGVKPIEAVGKPFDPNFHNAVMHVEDENLGSGTPEGLHLQGFHRPSQHGAGCKLTLKQCDHPAETAGRPLIPNIPNLEEENHYE